MRRVERGDIVELGLSFVDPPPDTVVLLREYVAALLGEQTPTGE